MAWTRESICRILQQTQEATESLGRNFEEPEYIRVGSTNQFRHAEKNDLLQSWLKCVRAVSTLNASLVLLDHGFFQEIGALCRGVDEFTQDVLFLGTCLGDEGPSKQQRQLLEEFFQEEFADLENPLTSVQLRNRVPRSKVLAGIGRIRGSPINPSDSQALHASLYKAFSGYVHGAYVHIMEMYGGPRDSLRFHMNGVDSEERYEEWIDAIASCLFRTVIAVQIVARRCGDDELSGVVENILDAFDQRGQSKAEDPQEMLKRLKARGKKT